MSLRLSGLKVDDANFDQPTAGKDEVTAYIAAKQAPYTRLHRVATGWRDITSDLSLAKDHGTAPPTWSVITGGIYGWSFSASVVQELQAAFHINHDYLPGSKIYPHVHWLPTNTNTGVVRWGQLGPVGIGYAGIARDARLRASPLAPDPSRTPPRGGFVFIRVVERAVRRWNWDRHAQPAPCRA